MWKYIIVALLQILRISAYAQFVQKGVTLEYNRSKSKTVYKKPVSILISNAEPSVSNNGSFALTFMKSAKAGDTISSPEIKVSDEQYVLFNKNRIQDWVLSPQKQMEVLVCKKDIIDYLESTYTNNYVNQLKKKYEQSQKQLRESIDDKEKLEKEFAKLKTDYERDVNLIRARAVLFAYVDETEKDSLELLRREYILNNNLERAWQIGEKMNLSGLANNYISNIHKSKKSYEVNLHHLHDCAVILEEQIQIYKLKDEHNISKVITPYYESLTEIYKCLLEEYRDSKRNEVLYNAIEDKLGKVLCAQDKLEEAAQHDNTDALCRLAENCDFGEQRDSAKCKSYLRQLLFAVKAKGRDLPYSRDSNQIFVFEEWLESFPDFSIEVNGAKFEYTILNDEEVSLVHYVHGKSKAKKVVVPKQVEYNGKKYVVTKIGRHIFFKDEGFYHGDWDEEESSCMNVSSLQLPNTITYVGEAAFLIGEPGRIDRIEPLIVNMPNSLKVIRNHAYYGCAFKNYVINIPEGVEYIGDAWEAWVSEDRWDANTGEQIEKSGENIGLTLRIPASAKEIHAMTDLNFPQEGNCQLIHKIELNPANKNFIMLNDLLYKADSSFVYAGGLYRDSENDTKTLYIPAQIRFETEEELEEFFSSQVVSDYVDSLVVDNSHPDISLYEGILYDKKREKLILKPKRLKRIVVPSTLNIVKFGWICDNYSGSHYYFPKEINPNMLIQIMSNEAHEDTTTIDYYGSTGTIIAQNNAERLNGLVSFMGSVIDVNRNDDKLNYIKGMFSLELYDVVSAIKILQQAQWKNNVYEEALRDKIEKTKKSADSLRVKIDEALRRLYSFDEYLHRDIVEHQEKFAECGTEQDVLDLAILYYLRGLVEESKEDYFVDYQEIAFRDFQRAICTIAKMAKDDSEKQNGYLSRLYGWVAVLYYDDYYIFQNESHNKNGKEIIDKHIKLSLDANPLNITSLQLKGLMHLHKYEYEEAKKTLEKIRAIDEEYANKSILIKELENK